MAERTNLTFSRCVRALQDLFGAVVMFLPGGVGVRLRRFIYKRRFRSLGRNVTIGVGVVIHGHERISIGDDVVIDPYAILETGPLPSGYVIHKENSFFLGRVGDLSVGSNVHICQGAIVMGYGGVAIGDRCTVGAYAKIYSLSNLPCDPREPEVVHSIMPYSQAPFLAGPVVLSDNVWVAVNTMLMPGVVIGRDSFAAANSVLVSSFMPNSYIVGQPAKQRGPRYGSRHSISTHD